MQKEADKIKLEDEQFRCGTAATNILENCVCSIHLKMSEDGM